MTETPKAGQLEPRGHWPIWSRPPLLWVRLGYLTVLNSSFSALYRFVRSRYRLWYWLSQHSSSRTESLGRLHAYLMCALARKSELASRVGAPAGTRLLSVFRVGRSDPPARSRRMR